MMVTSKRPRYARCATTALKQESFPGQLWGFLGNSPLRRRFHRKQRGRAACFSRSRKGRRHRRLLYIVY
ncbi:hypothetical protein Y032_0184g1002 [Ancylostoma ceylanicum]|uniref:Uncharacterized protein n=1 Tax=Ancylostoma ceylanicum TaxID=53326 RepID=A0A016SR87_9BILA|nr:hypothetical protein Y032_0184g1002 [Ancylostoma ceylanicum]